MTFRKDFKNAVLKHREQETDEYTELKYSDTFYIHVASYPDKKGSLELYAIVPHEEVDIDLTNERQGQLPPEIPGVDELYETLEDLLSEFTSDTHITFYLTDVVTDGSWERDASSYCTEEIKMR